jgi:hypothetical protein
MELRIEVVRFHFDSNHDQFATGAVGLGLTVTIISDRGPSHPVVAIV